MNSWSFPATIPSGTVANIYSEWDTNPLKRTADDGGEVTYLLSGTELNFQVQARAVNGFALQISLLNFSTQGNPRGTIIHLGWNKDGFVNFVLSGNDEGFISTNLPAASWIQSNLSLFGGIDLTTLTLNDLITLTSNGITTNTAAVLVIIEGSPCPCDLSPYKNEGFYSSIGRSLQRGL